MRRLAELAPLDFAAVELERLSAPQSALGLLGLTAESAANLLDHHLRQQVLDYLDTAYRFPVAPQLAAREHAVIRRAADEALASAPTTLADREAIEAELSAIAERRVRLGAVIVEMTRRYEIVPLEEELLRERRHREPLAQTWDRLREDKLIGLVVSRAHVIDRQATVEELRELRQPGEKITGLRLYTAPPIDCAGYAVNRRTHSTRPGSLPSIPRHRSSGPEPLPLDTQVTGQ